jgi:cell division protein FtsL
LCQAFERTVHREESQITAADTPTDKLKAIIDDYYKTQLNHNSITDKHTAHRLIEDELVIETGDGKGVRVTLHELSILVKFANRNAPEADEKIRLKHLLDALVNVHLLRREVGSRGGDTYELAHDRLVEPVLTSKKVYVAEVERQKIEAENKRREVELAEAKRQTELEKQRSTTLGIVLCIAIALFLLWLSQYYTSIENIKKVEQIVEKANSMREDLDSSNVMQKQQSMTTEDLLDDTRGLRRCLEISAFYYRKREEKVKNGFQEYDNLQQIKIQSEKLQLLLEKQDVLSKKRFARDSAIQVKVTTLQKELEELKR